MTSMPSKLQFFFFCSCVMLRLSWASFASCPCWKQCINSLNLHNVMIHLCDLAGVMKIHCVDMYTFYCNPKNKYNAE